MVCRAMIRNKSGVIVNMASVAAFTGVEGQFEYTASKAAVIGMTRRLEPQERIDELSGASVPFNFDVHALIFSEDAPALETALHHAFENKKINKVNSRREFFRVSLDEIKKEVRKNFDKTVEWIDFPEAEQFRQSVQINGFRIVRIFFLYFLFD